MRPRLSAKKALAILAVALLPISASAGLKFWRDAGAQELPQAKHVQDMALLVAAVTPLTESEPQIQIVDDNALVPEASPLAGTSGSLIYRPQSDQISVYVVREGDTLSQIAEMYGVSVNTIKWSNDLNSSTVKPGQTLVILPVSGVKHIVAKGDTLASIAKKYKGDLEEIAAYNGISADSPLAIGSEVIVPDGEVVHIPYSTGSSSSGGSSAGLKDASGYYIKPIAKCVKTQGLHGNNAIDLAAPAGTHIMAAAAGQVIVSKVGGWNGGYGNYIVIKHDNGTQTLYSHNSQNLVSVGDFVERGDVIGTVGNTGRVSGPTGNHLHFEVRGAKNPF